MDERGFGSGQRGSALWGTGSRGGDSRSSVLWGKGGRGFATMVAAALALAAPIVATADSGGSSKAPGWVQPLLLNKAKSSPDQLVPVIITSAAGMSDAENAYKGLGVLNRIKKQLGMVGGVAVDLPAKQVEKLATVPGLTVTYDAPVKVSGEVSPYTSNQLWVHDNGDSALWGTALKPAPQAPTIAIVDSGVDATRPDLAGRVVAQVSQVSLPGNSPGDGRGHGTFVAGIAAGSGVGYAGAAPNAKIFSVDVMDDRGVAATSDVIAAAQTILDNKDKYNIKVANFSLHSATPSSFTKDPLDKAVERLWFSGITVVVAAGNYGSATGPSGVKYAPGNDPFVITVGAADIGGSAKLGDDSTAPFSAYGYTYDGFLKPELAAAGRYMVGPVPVTATLASEKAANMVDKVNGYIQLSGTSFAAPVIAGTAAQLLARHPDWTPNQIKGALMATAMPAPKAPKGSAGVGQVNAVKAAALTSPPNPNAGLMAFVKSASGGSGLAFDSVSWSDYAKANVSWNAVSWSDVSWSDVSWSDVSWSSVSWSDVSWSDVSWSDVSWSDLSYEDAAEGDAALGDLNGYDLSASALTELTSDPELAALGIGTATTSGTTSTTSGTTSTTSGTTSTTSLTTSTTSLTTSLP